jgi:excisionase family DNA binding protein
MYEAQLEERIAKAVKEHLTPFFSELKIALGRPEKGYFTITEAAAFVGCSEAHIRRHVTGGMLPVANIGTNDGPDYRIAREDLVAWVEKRKAGALPPPRKKKDVPTETTLPFSSHRRPSKYGSPAL